MITSCGYLLHVCVCVQYMYDTGHMLAQNGLVGSRVVQQGMLASQVGGASSGYVVLHNECCLYCSMCRHQPTTCQATR